MKRQRRPLAIAMRLIETLGLVKTYSREGIDELYHEVDVVMHRWAASAGDGLPREEGAWDERAKARLPALNDGDAVVVERIYNALPEPQHQLAFLWWKVPQERLTPTMIEEQLGYPEGTIYQHVNRLLAALQVQLRADGIDC